MKTIWMSFVDPEKEPGQRFLGVAIVDVSPEDEAEQLELHPEMYDKANGPMVAAAAAKAWRLDCNPGGEVSASRMRGEIAEGVKNRLLSESDLLALGFIEKKESIH